MNTLMFIHANRPSSAELAFLEGSVYADTSEGTNAAEATKRRTLTLRLDFNHILCILGQQHISLMTKP